MKKNAINNDLQILYNLKNGDIINTNECARINRILAITKIDNIPKDQLENVKNYLTNALNMNSIELDLIEDLDKLELLQTNSHRI